MKPGDAYCGLRDAARSRQESDWLVGINCTRAQTLVMRKAGGEGVYSIGRVQTPTLALLVNRELEITDFVPKDFWTLWAISRPRKAPQGQVVPERTEGQDRFETRKRTRRPSRAAGRPAGQDRLGHRQDGEEEAGTALRPHEPAEGGQQALRVHGGTHAGGGPGSL